MLDSLSPRDQPRGIGLPSYQPITCLILYVNIVIDWIDRKLVPFLKEKLFERLT